MSLLLGIETSSLRYAVVFGRGERVLFNSGDHGELPPDLAGLVEHGLGAIGARAADIAVIAVNIGPGGLGAVRAGVSFANALAYGLGRPVCPFTAFELIGFEAWRKNRVPILCIRSTSHGNAYVGLYDGVAVTTMRYGQLAAIVAEVAGTLDRLGVAGTSRNRIAEMLPRATVIDTGVESARAPTFIAIGCAGRPCVDPATSRVSPLTEQSRIFHEPA